MNDRYYQNILYVDDTKTLLVSQILLAAPTPLLKGTLTMSQIIIYGTWWCGDTKRALRILDKRQVKYTWIDIDKDPAGEKLVKQINNGYRSVPTILFPDESILVEPSNRELNEKLDAMDE